MLEFENLVCFDIDDTIALWNAPNKDSIQVKGKSGKCNFFTPHERHIKYLKQLKLQKYTVLVWSAAGKEHAKLIITALKLQKYVDIIADKPSMYFDDKQANSWMGPRVFLDGASEQQFVVDTTDKLERILRND